MHYNYISAPKSLPTRQPKKPPKSQHFLGQFNRKVSGTGAGPGEELPPLFKELWLLTVFISTGTMFGDSVWGQCFGPASCTRAPPAWETTHGFFPRAGVWSALIRDGTNPISPALPAAGTWDWQHCMRSPGGTGPGLWAWDK